MPPHKKIEKRRRKEHVPNRAAVSGKACDPGINRSAALAAAEHAEARNVRVPQLQHEVLAVIGDGFHHLVAHVLKAPQLLRVLLPARVVFVVPCAAAEHW